MLVKLMHFTKILTVSNRILIMIFHPMTGLWEDYCIILQYLDQ